MTTKTATKPNICGCCGGYLPSRDVWEITRYSSAASECTGAVEPRTLRCYAFVDDSLWTLDDSDSDGVVDAR